MNTKIPTNKKLLVQFRLEPGCLGPDGVDHIANFCAFAQKKIGQINAEFIRCELIPRFDKSLAEIEYSILGKRLNESQVTKYLKSFNQELSDLKELLDEQIALLIEQYFNR